MISLLVVTRDHGIMGERASQRRRDAEGGHFQRTTQHGLQHTMEKEESAWSASACTYSKALEKIVRAPE